jgi:hypothetical protein
VLDFGLVLQDRDVLARIAIDHEQTGEHAGGDATDLSLEVEHTAVVVGPSGDRLDRRQPGVAHQQLELGRVPFAVRRHGKAGVGAEAEQNTDLVGKTETLVRSVEHSLACLRDRRRAGTLTARDRDAILTAAAARRPLPGSERRLAAKLAAKFWVANGELAGEVTSTLAGVDLQRPAGEVLENVNRALEAITAFDRQPVIVVDDSDSFTRRHSTGRTRDELVGAFFGPVLRALTELHAGLIVAVHDEYLEMESFERARREHGALERLLAVPPVVSGQLERILDRGSQLAANVTSDAALSPGAVELLAELNRARTARNLRTTLGIAHAALVAAVDRGADSIEEQDVARAAIEQLGT